MPAHLHRHKGQLTPLPTPVATQDRDPRPRVNLSRLSPQQKRQLWEALKTHNPALSNLLQDPGLQALAKHFNAQIRVFQDDLPPMTEGSPNESPENPERA